MEPYPHLYSVTASGQPAEDVELSASGLPRLQSAPPAEFGGPGDRWSPETLLVAALVDCFVLTFRAVARASQLAWTRIECRGEGVLERADAVTRFTGMTLHARLTVPREVDCSPAERLLVKAETSCLVTNSLDLEPTLTAEVLQE